MFFINKIFLFDVFWIFVIVVKGEGFFFLVKFKCVNDFFKLNIDMNKKLIVLFKDK